MGDRIKPESMIRMDQNMHHYRLYRTLNEARADVFDYIERFHNSRMRRSVAAQSRNLSAVLKPSVETG
jgi:putative transposase